MNELQSRDEQLIVIDNIEVLYKSEFVDYIHNQSYPEDRIENDHKKDNNVAIITFDIHGNNKSYRVNVPHNSFELQLKSENEIICLFCGDVCRVNKRRQYRCLDSPWESVLEICTTCPDFDFFVSQLKAKEIKLEHDGQFFMYHYKQLEINNNDEFWTNAPKDSTWDKHSDVLYSDEKDVKMFYALYDNTIFVWDACHDYRSMIYKPCKFKDFIIAEEEVGIINENIQIHIGKNINNNIKEKQPNHNRGSDKSIFSNSCKREIPYKVDLNRDIDRLIMEAKESAKNQELQFYFPPKQINLSQPLQFATEINLCLYNIQSQNFNGRLDIEKEIIDIEFMRFSEMDVVLALHFLKFCSLGTICELGKINKWWRKITRTYHIWEYFLKKDFPNKDTKLKYGGYRVKYIKFYSERNPQQPIKSYNHYEQCYEPALFHGGELLKRKNDYSDNTELKFTQIDMDIDGSEEYNNNKDNDNEDNNRDIYNDFYQIVNDNIQNLDFVLY